MSETSQSTWHDIIFSSKDAGDVWKQVFAQLLEIAQASPDAASLHRETVIPDRLLAETAWDLWERFTDTAPRVVPGLMEFWSSAKSNGTAILILDALSLRELPLILSAASTRKVAVTRVEVRGAEVPTETEHFAAAMGLPGRSKLFNNQPPDSFIFKGPDTYCDVLDAPFADCVAVVPPTPRVFLWHKWPDEPLIHLHEAQPDGDKAVAQKTKVELFSDGFWNLVNRLRQGRRLVITGDHGYATRRWFTTEVSDEETKKLLRETFGAKRSVREDPASPWPRRHVPPLVLRKNGWLTILGQRWWPAHGGYPFLCHRGVTLLEAAVPFIELPPL